MKSIFKILKTLSRIGMILFIFFSIFNFGAVYGKRSLPNEGVLDFANRENEWEWNRLSSEMPAEAKEAIQEYNNIAKKVRIALIFMFLTLFFDYFIDPKNHFMFKIINKIKEVKEKGFEEEDEEKDLNEDDKNV